MIQLSLSILFTALKMVCLMFLLWWCISVLEVDFQLCCGKLLLESLLPLFHPSFFCCTTTLSLVYSLVAQTVVCLQCRRPGFDLPSVGKIPWRKIWQPTPVFLPGQRSLAGCHPWGHRESDTTWVTNIVHTTAFFGGKNRSLQIEEPLFYRVAYSFFLCSDPCLPTLSLFLPLPYFLLFSNFEYLKLFPKCTVIILPFVPWHTYLALLESHPSVCFPTTPILSATQQI